MQSFPQTVIIRHQKENLKKCSLKGLEQKKDFLFFKYPLNKAVLPQLNNYILLTVDGQPLSANDSGCGLLILDGTWRLVERMRPLIVEYPYLIRRSIPSSWKTAYPRRQDDCPLLGQGLASIEAIFAAYHILGRETSGLLDNYYWKDRFLNLNLG